MQPDAYDLVTQRLAKVTRYTAKNERAGWRCPAHDDSTPSLSVSRGTKGVVLHCHGGCEPDRVLQALGLERKDLFDEPSTNGKHATEEIVDTYTYRDEKGRTLFQVVRFHPKTFRQRRPDGNGGWIWGLEGKTRRVLYRLPQLVAGIAAGKPIFVCEGEKDVHAVEAAGGVATCNPGGAGKWRPEYSASLVGADVIIVADRDDVGRQHAIKVHAAIADHVHTARTVEPTEGKDAYDHLHAGRTLDELLAEPEPEPPRPLTRIPIDLRTQPEPPAMLLAWLYAERLTVLQSEPGVGKSWLAAWFAWGAMLAGYSVIYIDEEGGPDLIHERLSYLGADADLVANLFFYYAFESRTWGDEDLAALDSEMRKAAAVAPLGLGILDSLPDFLNAAMLDEDRARDITTFVGRVCGRFRNSRCACLLLDHLTKPPNGEKRTRSRYSRGSGAKLAKADATLLLETHTEFDINRSGSIRLWKTKDRRGRLPLPNLTKPGLAIEIAVGDGTISFEPGDPDNPPKDSGPFRPTGLMEHVSIELENSAKPLSKRNLRTLIRGDNSIIDIAIERLVGDGFIRHTPQGYVTVRPYRQDQVHADMEQHEEPSDSELF